MGFFHLTFGFLLLFGYSFVKMHSPTRLESSRGDLKRLQRTYFIPFFLATFSDWIQGPYVYKVYRDYNIRELDIGLLYVVGFISSMLFGPCVGLIADRFGRKLICMIYGVIYSVCCFSKFFPQFYILFIGRICGGIATSILLSGFESWYINEHNYRGFNDDWMNETFAAATFGSGLVAIIAGIVSHLVADVLNFGAVAPFALAVPFLLGSTIFIFHYWDEHFSSHRSLPVGSTEILSSWKVLLYQPPLLTLGIVQSIFDGIMYTFIFAWTPVLESVTPPLGIVFACFMACLMLGSQVYSIFISKKFRAESLLVFILFISLLCMLSLALLTSSLFDSSRVQSTYYCFVAFLLYEVAVGIYMPATGYLRSKIISENVRVTITNWLRVPTNLITCFTLFFLKNEEESGDTLNSINTIFIVSSVCMVIALVAGIYFERIYWKKRCHEKLISDVPLTLSKPEMS